MVPPPELADAELGNYPYLAANFAFQERVAGSAPWLKHIHCFNYGATVSLGKISGDIPAVSEGAQGLVRALVASLARAQVTVDADRAVEIHVLLVEG